MTEKELIQQLSDLNYTHASKSLHGRVAAIVDDLPNIHKRSLFPLFAFQMAIVGVVLLILVGLGSGAVVAAQSTPGTPLFPVKEMLHKIIPRIVENAFPSPTPVEPTPTLIPTVTMSPTKTVLQNKHHVQVGGEDEGEHEDEHDDNFLQKVIQKVQDVKGAHDERVNNSKQKNNDDHNENEQDK